MIGTIDIKINAAHPNMPLSDLYTFLGSPQQVRIINVPKAIGNWKITAVQITVNYPDNSSPSVEATLTGGCWHGTLPAPSATGKSLMGFKITASGVDEHGDPITGYVLGKGDAYVLDDDATITVGGTTYYVHMLDVVPVSPRKGDLAVIDNIYQLYDGSRWHPLGNQATISWSDVTGKPTEFPPEAHVASHKTGGTDALTPADIGAVAAVPGKGLSTNDYTNAEKTKLAGIEAGAEVNPTPVAPSTEIAEGATADAKKVAEFVNSSINAMAAFYITKNAAGDAFATKAELTAAITSGTFYNGGALRTPTKNDYLYVLADESATQIIPGVNPTTRYSYDGAQWAFQITVNNTALTSAQAAAINSGITAALVLWLLTFKGADTATTLASVLSALAEKRDKTDFVIIPETRIKDDFLPITGGSYDWSSHRLEKQDDGSYYLYAANDAYAAIFNADGTLNSADQIYFGGERADNLYGEKLLDVADNIARESQVEVKANKTELTSKANLTDLPYKYNGYIAYSIMSVDDGKISRIYSSGYTYLNINPTITLPTPATGKIAECVLRWNTGSTVHAPTLTLPSGKTAQSYSISGDTPEANSKYEMFVQIVPTSTTNTYEVISVTRKLA